MEDYLYTGDTGLLRAHCQVLRDTLQFYVEFMTEGPNGWRVTNPSSSPENTYYLPNSTVPQAISIGPTVDNSIIWELVGFTLEAMDILEEDDEEFRRSITVLRDQLPPIQVSYFGGVQEWIFDYEEAEIGHRHYSSLFGLFPGSQITSANATTFDAAKTTLVRRLENSGGDTGWSRAWTIALAARSLLNYEVHDSLVHLLTRLTYNASLLDTGPPAPFQIDGNFGGTAGIAEALLQSHELVESQDEATEAEGSHLVPTHWGHSEGSKTTLLRLLPALPIEWAENGGGSVTGLRARGGFEVDIQWDSSGALTAANVTSQLGENVWITVGSELIGRNAAKINGTGGPIRVEGAGRGRFVLLRTEVGRTYSVTGDD